MYYLPLLIDAVFGGFAIVWMLMESGSFAMVKPTGQVWVSTGIVMLIVRFTVSPSSKTNTEIVILAAVILTFVDKVLTRNAMANARLGAVNVWVSYG
jgi:hypothetical protein